MGTEITLDIAGTTLCWSKNSKGIDHGELFQEIDRKRIQSDQINYDYFKEKNESPALMEMGFSRKLKDVLPRLNLLGFTKEQVRLEYLKAIETCIEEERDYHDDSLETSKEIMTFEEFCTFISLNPLAELNHIYDEEKNDEEIKGRFSENALKKRLPYPLLYELDGYTERSYFGRMIGFLHPYSALVILAENSKNLEENVVWQYGPLVDSGWAKESEFLPAVRRTQTFLIATEGSSDVHVLKHAISIIYPEIEDFFRFIDVEQGHPFSGTGNLVKFAFGLAKIDVHNQTVFLFDNDGEGFEACQKVKSASLPLNMRAIMLPELEQFRSFPTRGPQGITNSDINNRAAAIECYLDLSYDNAPSPQVVWTNYKKELNIYHGALDNKDTYVKTFLRMTASNLATASYDVNKIRAVLDTLIKECCSIAQSVLLATRSR